MALFSRRSTDGMAHQNAAGYDADPRQSSAAVDERQSTHSSEGLNSVLRAVAALAGGVATVIGIVALIRIDWNDGLSSAPVEVAGLSFSPGVAVAATLIGLVVLAVGASADRSSKLAVGAVLVCLGIAIVIAGERRSDFDLETAHGWFALIVGAVLLAAGLLMRNYWVSHRSVRAGGYQA